MGCYAPLHSPGVPAQSLPEEYRVPQKACSFELNYAALTAEYDAAYRLRPDDFVRVEIADLLPRPRRLPAVNATEERNQNNAFSYTVESQLTKQGELLLPLVGAVNLNGKTLEEAKRLIVDTYNNGFLDDPKVAVTLVQERTNRIMVLGAVANPNVYELPWDESDVAHAISLAGGLLPESADEIQVHRKALPGRDDLDIVRIPLRANHPPMWGPEHVTLEEGDVVCVKTYADEVFFVTGRLSPNNLVRFTLGQENRDLGNGFILPKDRDVDVITAVAMAGYIDPIDSPTTVTVHRRGPEGEPMLIRVDLIAARYNRRENLMIQGGDIIYLNPDGAWWFRRTLDRIVPDLLTVPYSETLRRAINPGRFN